MRAQLWKLANLFDRDYRAFRREIARYVACSEDGARDLRRRWLHRYLRYCREYSPYWRERWPRDAGDFAPDEAEEVLARLPVLTKEDVRRHIDELRVAPQRRRRGDGYPRIGRQTTVTSGGSTGMPVRVYTDSAYGARVRASYDFLYSLCGMHPGEPAFFLWGSPNELRDIQESPRKRLATRLRGLHRIPAFGLTPERIRSIADELRRNPEIRSAMCFASAAESVVEFAEHEGLELPRLDRVLSGGGLLHPRLRTLVERHLADQVYDTYAGRDIGMVAHETPGHDGLSLVEWLSRIEVLDAQGRRVPDGGSGEVHVTQMHNFSCALIRMQTGDTACWHAGPGRNPIPGDRIRELRGRMVEHLEGPGGVVIDPSAVIHVIGVVIEPPWLKKFQLVQRAPDRFELRVVGWDGDPGPGALDALARRAADELGSLAGAALQVRVVWVDDIPPQPSGKHLYCLKETD